MNLPGGADRSWLVRWSPLGGLIFVVGCLVFAFTPAFEDVGDTPVEVVAYAEANEGWILTFSIFALLALLLVGWFVAGLVVRLRDVGADQEATIALIGGVIFTALCFLAFTIFTAPLFGITEDDPEPAEKLSIATTLLNVDDIGWVTLGGSGVAVGLMAIAASLGALRTRSAPAWAGWVGVALGVLSLATIAFFGIFAWLAWILFASLGMLFYRAPATNPRASTP